MDVKQAITVLTGLMHKCTDVADVQQACEALQTITRALEWQPMETAPENKVIACRIVDVIFDTEGLEYLRRVGGKWRRHATGSELGPTWKPTGWKEVE